MKGGGKILADGRQQTKQSDKQEVRRARKEEKYGKNWEYNEQEND
jgi:hypothetical protein